MKSALQFLAVLILAPLAPVFFGFQWISLKDREYLATPKERKWIILERAALSFIVIVGIISLILVVDSYPSADYADKGEACIPYGQCY